MFRIFVHFSGQQGRDLFMNSVHSIEYWYRNFILFLLKLNYIAFTVTRPNVQAVDLFLL